MLEAIVIRQGVSFVPVSASWLCANESDPSAKKPFAAPATSKANSARRIVGLLAEDNRADVLLIEEALKLQGLSLDLHVVDDGEKACQFIERADADPAAPCPEVLLLDLNLPKRTGREVLKLLRNSKNCKDIPVLIITSSGLTKERDELMQLGANSYFRKPTSYDDFMQVGAVLKDVLTAHGLQ